MKQVLSLLKPRGPNGRYFRYALTLIGGCGLIIGLALLVWLVTPRTYTSGFTLILPGAGPSASVNLDTLGQASSNSSSPFSSPSLSPTENYKKLFQSYRLRGHVAERLGLSMSEVRAPDIRLANQTKLIYVKVSSDSPVAAKALADAWLSVFEAELKALRDEEQSIREDAFQESLATFERAVEESRAKIIAFQSEYGLISVEQFQALVERGGALKVEAQQAARERDVAAKEVLSLSRLLDLSAEQASDILLLQSDPVYQSVYRSYAEAEGMRAQLVEIYGANHPERRAVEIEAYGLKKNLGDRGRKLLGLGRYTRLRRYNFGLDAERTRLMGALVQASSAQSGANERHLTIEKQIQETRAQIDRMAGPATELDGLLRDHQIAETVFASALARVDTSRTDMFASYPLTQTVELPAQPKSPSSPSKKLMALAVFGGCFLYIMGLILLWIRMPLLKLVLKTV
ncbi:MAG: hypothetical protein AAFX02_01865 [Pseudomonadota bacterium]